jgi:diguanylate cyclase (GGDEF)-like protein/PAS domain S-box-containing protein
MPSDDQVEMFRSVALSSPDGVIVADDRGVVTWVNPAADDIFGYPPGDLVGEPLTTMIAPELREQTFELRRQVLRGADPGTFVTQGWRRDATSFPLSLTTAVRRDPTGRVLGISAIARDVTAELQVQRDLTDALARSHARFDQVAEPQALLDLEARIVAVNDAGCRLLDRRREDLIGRDSRRLAIPVDPAEAVRQLDLLTSGEADAIGYEVTFLRGDGSEVPAMVDASMVRDGDGRPREVALFARDLSEVQEAQRRLADQDAFFRALYRGAADPAIVVDRHADVSYVSPAFSQVFGWAPEQVVGRPGFEWLHPDDWAVASEALAELVEDGRQSARVLVRGLTATGSYRWFEGVATNCLDEPVIGGVVVNLREMSAVIEARDRLRRSEARYRAMVETAQEGIITMDTDGRILFANDSMAEIFGYDPGRLEGTSILDYIEPEEQAGIAQRVRHRGRIGPERYEMPYTRPDGSRRTLSISASPLVDVDGVSAGSLGMVSDVTAQRQADAELRHQALHDGLTGLPNRTLLVDRLAMAGHRQQRDHGHGLAVLFVDLDHFKLVNDSRGHEAGDRLLVEVARRITFAVRETDTVARLGGDEFAIVCEGFDRREAEQVADRVLGGLRQPFELDGQVFYVNASIGIALSPPHPVGDLLRFADAAMYESKSDGRGRSTTFDRPDDVTSERRLLLAAGLRVQLEEGPLTLGYQPIVDLRSGRLVGLEALLRFEHPLLGPVGAEEVVEIAEMAGLSFELDRAVIRTSNRDLLALRAAGVAGDDVVVSVNISPRTTAHHQLDTLVEGILGETGLHPATLSLELTEHAIMDNANHAAALLNRLAGMGVGIAVDDFGTGYNSLVHLQRLPVRTLKIDRSFIADLGKRPEADAIARSVVGLAGALGLSTVAEGVETPEQAQQLREMGCDAAQGYLWGPATRPADLLGVLAELEDVAPARPV